MKTEYLLDASALLAALFAEPGADRVAEILGKSAISAVNVTEVVACQMRRGASAELAKLNVESLGLKVLPWDEELSLASVDISALAWTHGLSLGDRACLATARLKRLKAVTADRKWTHLPPFGFSIEVVR